MAALRKMPKVTISQTDLADWGRIWLGTEGEPKMPKPLKRPRRRKGEPILPPPPAPEPIPTVKAAESFDPTQKNRFGAVFDKAFGKALAEMLGGIPVMDPPNTDVEALRPVHPDCVEVGRTRIVGAIRPQNYDAAYRPDGPRVVFDSKTLNGRKSIGKNWQNMVNDLTAEASTVHIRFPMCIVAFMVAVPRPALPPNQERDLIRTLERLGSREDELDQHNLAESVALIVWNPEDGSIDPNVPPKGSNLRIETFSQRVEAAYMDRYKNLPPHQESDAGEGAEDAAETETGDDA